MPILVNIYRYLEKNTREHLDGEFRFYTCEALCLPIVWLLTAFPFLCLVSVASIEILFAIYYFQRAYRLAFTCQGRADYPSGQPELLDKARLAVMGP